MRVQDNVNASNEMHAKISVVSDCVGHFLGPYTGCIAFVAFGWKPCFYNERVCRNIASE